MYKGVNKCFLKSKYVINCYAFSSSQIPKPRKFLDKIQNYIEIIQSRYEDVVGLTTIKKIQNDVMEMEKALIDAQLKRQGLQNELDDLRTKIKHVTIEMEKTPRGHDAYLKLITEEHSLLKLETPLQKQFNIAVDIEKSTFEELSRRVRHSHEKERERVEKTRFFSLFCTCIGTGVGIFGSIIIDYIKNKRLKDLYGESGKLKPLITDISNKIDKVYLNHDSDESKKFTEQIVQLENIYRKMNVLLTGILNNINKVNHDNKNDEIKKFAKQIVQMEDMYKEMNVLLTDVSEKVNKINVNHDNKIDEIKKFAKQMFQLEDMYKKMNVWLTDVSEKVNKFNVNHVDKIDEIKNFSKQEVQLEDRYVEIKVLLTDVLNKINTLNINYNNEIDQIKKFDEKIIQLLESYSEKVNTIDYLKSEFVKSINALLEMFKQNNDKNIIINKLQNMGSNLGIVDTEQPSIISKIIKISMYTFAALVSLVAVFILFL
ncbi:Hypothetical protein SRAE_2000021300 [Strongyloides ratti]|uniref:Uncharacterized protein n=1 Tax=Strongyloides ratti TaxID=34506 RepID=A0A090MXJ3_STRRB|nr:Hypothetical protein SRAE_2000021300 [Strongyloides ratti]CEF65534.1 Hypothetical protein SRAE_2000021300 [Strongyloides ratti]